MEQNNKNLQPFRIDCEDEDTYKIYDYMKSHPGTFVALLPIVFTVVSYVGQYIPYLQEQYTAQIWNIPIENIETNSLTIYLILEKMLQTLLFTLTIVWLYISFNAYFSRKKPFMIRDRVVNITKKALKKLRSGISSDAYSKLKKDVDEAESLIGELEGIKDDSFAGLTREIFKGLVIYLSLNFILSSVKINDWCYMMWCMIFCFAFYLFFVLLIWVSCYSSVRKEINKECDFSPESEILNSLKNVHGLLYEAYESLKGIDVKFYLGEYVKIYGVRSLFSDAKIKSFVHMIAILSLGYLVWQKVYFSFFVPDNLTFPIVTESDKTYAVVYQTKDIYVLESATINNNEITIDTTQQRIIKTSDFAYEVKEFSSVKRLKLDAQNEENDVSIDSSTNVQDTLIEQNPLVSDLANDTAQDTINEPTNDNDNMEESSNNDDDSDTLAETANDTIKNEQGSGLKNDKQ